MTTPHGHGHSRRRRRRAWRPPGGRGSSTSTRTQSTEHDRLQSVNYRTGRPIPHRYAGPVISCRSRVTCPPHQASPAEAGLRNTLVRVNEPRRPRAGSHRLRPVRGRCRRTPGLGGCRRAPDHPASESRMSFHLEQEKDIGMTSDQARQVSQASDLRLLELAPGLEPGTCCLQDRSESSMACWPVLPLQLRSGGSSSQCAPVGPSDGRWNDRGNDRRPLPWCAGSWRPAPVTPSVTLSGRRSATLATIPRMLGGGSAGGALDAERTMAVTLAARPARWRRWPAVLAWVLAGLTVLTLMSAFWLAELVWSTGWEPRASNITIGAIILVTVSTATVGALLASRQPRHSVGWLLVGIGLALVVALLVQSYVDYGLLARPGRALGRPLPGRVRLQHHAHLAILCRLCAAVDPDRAAAVAALALVGQAGGGCAGGDGAGVGRPAEPAGPGVRRPWWSPHCSSRPAAASSGRSTGASTAAATMPPGPSQRSARGYATRST